jgi:hypothetical protein
LGQDEQDLQDEYGHQPVHPALLAKHKILVTAQAGG